MALEGCAPDLLVLSRQAMPTPIVRSWPLPRSWRGAYVLSEAEGGAPQVILIGTGSELFLCVEAQGALARQGVRARVVSMPSFELFEAQDEQ